jgi:hypothetical protein
VEGHEADGADNMHMDVEEGNDGAGKSEGKNEEKSQDDGAEQGKEKKNTNSGPSYQGSKECFKPTEEDAVMFQNEQQKYSPIQATGNACLNGSQEAHAFNNSVLITQDILKDRRRRPEGGGGEWEPIKIPHRNLAYVQNRPNVPLF